MPCPFDHDFEFRGVVSGVLTIYYLTKDEIPKCVILKWGCTYFEPNLNNCIVILLIWHNGYQGQGDRQIKYESQHLVRACHWLLNHWKPRKIQNLTDPLKYVVRAALGSEKCNSVLSNQRNLEKYPINRLTLLLITISLSHEEDALL